MKLHITYDHPIPINAFEWTPATYRQSPHVHASLEIGLCLSGKGAFFFGNKRYAASPGDLFIVNNEERHIAQSDPDDPSRYLFINFDAAMLLAEEPGLLLPFSYRSTHFCNHIAGGSALAQELTPWILAIAEELQVKSAGYLAMAKSALIQLCGRLLRHYNGLLTEVERQTMVQSVRQIQSLAALVEQRYREPISLGELADELGLSVSRVSRAFLETTGYRFSDYVSLLRIQSAKQDLTGTDKAVAHIAFECGFQSLPTFYRVFKEIVGMSPIVYRQSIGVAH
ncbi:AraC family transcriptional regulator [Paenibacillus selenitireducens]|uniref:AraC family transcriptional regulator n=1 Tax=Paenibacillus selenitireducens TaxID=1324314 RepID=A0A1T2X103_9BACL|nr:AraC family transcriptional regulator [Paenibacillus selenitireducens]OPA73598.1 AraC family transcriptional regulator [Paenibacillus selenitireducens]